VAIKFHSRELMRGSGATTKSGAPSVAGLAISLLAQQPQPHGAHPGDSAELRLAV